MRYIIITAKHHDGFAMYPSDASKYNIRDHCGFKRDPMKELADECRRQGLGFGFYYSHRVDWHAPGGAGYRGDDKSATFDDYWKRKCLPQVEELTTRYGPLTVMWFDLGCKDREKVRQLEALVRKNQPNCVINSRIGVGAGDYASQKDCFVPSVPIDSPWETHMTLNNHWAWYPQDANYKSPQEIIRMLAAVRSRGGNFLLNVGPDNTGRIPCVETVTLKMVGQWMNRFGEAIHSVGASPLPAFPWGQCTRRGNRLFLHVFEWPADGTLFVPGLLSPVDAAYPMAAPRSKPLAARSTPFGTEVTITQELLAAASLSEDDTVLVLDCKAPLRTDPTPVLDHDFDNTLAAATARIHPPLSSKRQRIRDTGLDPAVRANSYIQTLRGWNAGAAAEWSFHNARKDNFPAVVEYTLKSDAKAPAKLLVSCDGQTAEATLPPTRFTDPTAFARLRIATLPVSAGKNKSLRIKLIDPKSAPGLEISSIILKPSRIR
jgi:alpha-L-fucosidase